ncbi:MAG TPA: hypothetical protein VF188_17660 [Longimicrobiales bacterium]
MSEPDPILDLLEQRALRTAAEEVLEPEIDLREALGTAQPDAAIPDVTLGGYIAEHDRPPAFTGSDDQPYTVAIDVDETDDPDRPFAGFLLFLRWAATGAGIMEHIESGDLAYGATEDEVRHALLDLSLYEVKAELDAAIARHQAELEA